VTKPRTVPKVMTDPRQMIAYLEQRRIAQGLSYAEIQARIGTHIGFNYVVKGRTKDLKMETMFRLAEVLGLEIEIRPKPVVNRTQRVMAARKAAAQSESPSAGAEE
jgi:hypothetical protein